MRRISEVRAKDAFPFPHCYNILNVCTSALSQATQSLSRQKVFQIIVINKTFENNDRLNLQNLVTGNVIHGVLLKLVKSFCVLCTAGY